MARAHSVRERCVALYKFVVVAPIVAVLLVIGAPASVAQPSPTTTAGPNSSVVQPGTASEGNDASISLTQLITLAGIFVTAGLAIGLYLVKVSVTFGRLETKVDASETARIAIETRVVTLEAGGTAGSPSLGQTAWHVELQGIRDKIDALDAKIEARLQRIDGRVDNSESQQSTALNQLLTEMQSFRANLNSEMQNLRSDFNIPPLNLAVRLAEVEARLRELDHPQ
jgi:hypothetical protein